MLQLTFENNYLLLQKTFVTDDWKEVLKLSCHNCYWYLFRNLDKFVTLISLWAIHHSRLYNQFFYCLSFRKYLLYSTQFSNSLLVLTTLDTHEGKRASNNCSSSIHFWQEGLFNNDFLKNGFYSLKTKPQWFSKQKSIY